MRVRDLFMMFALAATWGLHSSGGSFAWSAGRRSREDRDRRSGVRRLRGADASP